MGEFRSLLASPGILRCEAGKLKLGIYSSEKDNYSLEIAFVTVITASLT